MLRLQRNAKGISIKIQLMLISLANKLKWQGAQLSQLFIAGLRDINIQLKSCQMRHSCMKNHI